MRYLFPALCLAVLFSPPATAQFKIGLEAGPDWNQLRTTISNVVSTEYVSVIGYHVDIPLQYKIRDWFSVEAAPSFLQKNYKLQWTGPFSSLYQTNKNGYAQIPLMGNFLFTSHRIQFVAQVGGYAGYWVYGRVKGNLPDPFINTYSYDSAYVFRSNRDERWELGWLAGGRLAYDCGKTGQVFIDGRYYESVTGRQKNYMTGQIQEYDRTWVFSVGLLFNKLPRL